MHGKRCSAAADHAEGDRAVVTTQAKARGAVGLAYGRLQRSAAIDNVIGDRRHGVAPERGLAGRAVDGVAEKAKVSFRGGLDRAGHRVGHTAAGAHP